MVSVYICDPLQKFCHPWNSYEFITFSNYIIIMSIYFPNSCLHKSTIDWDSASLTKHWSCMHLKTDIYLFILIQVYILYIKTSIFTRDKCAIVWIILTFSLCIHILQSNNKYYSLKFQFYVRTITQHIAEQPFSYFLFRWHKWK